MGVVFVVVDKPVNLKVKVDVGIGVAIGYGLYLLGIDRATEEAVLGCVEVVYGEGLGVVDVSEAGDLCPGISSVT